MNSSSVAIQLRNEELERKLAEMNGKAGSSGTSSTSVAIQLRNQELERKLAEMYRKAGSSGMSSTSVAIQQKNQELEQELAKIKLQAASTGKSSTSVAIQQKNQDLERKLVEMERQAGSAGMSSTSVANQQKIQELERKVLDLESRRVPSVRIMSSASVAIHQTNQQLECKVAESEWKKTAGAGLLDSKRKMATFSSARQEKGNARAIQLNRLIKASQELDLAFLVDATKSMQPIIDSVKEKAHSIAARVMRAWPKLKLRVAFAPYRDYEDTARDNAEMCDFTDDFAGQDSVFVRAVARVRAGCLTNDQAEDVFSGLQRVASLSWKSRTRVLVHIGDAPCHGAEFYDHAYDRCPEGDLKGRNISTLLRTLRDDCQIICYLFCHVEYQQTKKMLRVFKKQCDDERWIQEEQLSSIDKLVDVVVNVSTTSISHSIQEGDISRATLKFIPLTVKPEMPQSDKIQPERATQIRYKLPGSLEDLFNALATNGKLEMEDMQDSTVQIARYPFSGEGSLRWPYHAFLHQPLGAPRHMVVKRFKTTLGQGVNRIHSKDAYFEQMEVQTVAAKMAEEFNKELKSIKEDFKTVQFTSVSTLRVGSFFYNIEPYLVGSWIRYSNNLNYVNTKEYAATLHAFSHWTYHRSKGLLLVNDLQGVETMAMSGSTEFWLCDPSVHCKDALRYERTRTNWGEPGMKTFLETHQCNYICRKLGLTPTTTAPLLGDSISRRL